MNVDVTDKFQRHPMKQTAQSSTNVGSWCFQIFHALQTSLKFKFSTFLVSINIQLLVKSEVNAC